jgi:hypothetical protein
MNSNMFLLDYMYLGAGTPNRLFAFSYVNRASSLGSQIRCINNNSPGATRIQRSPGDVS